MLEALFVERICTLGELRRQEDMLHSDFRTWCRERGESLKKDPVPPVVAELTQVCKKQSQSVSLEEKK